MDKPIRIGVKVPGDVNSWLDKESKRTGVAKSSLVYMMIDKYISDKRKIESNNEMPALFTQTDDVPPAGE